MIEFKTIIFQLSMKTFEVLLLIYTIIIVIILQFLYIDVIYWIFQWKNHFQNKTINTKMLCFEH